MNTLVVTGARGFVGSHVVERAELHEFHSVAAEGDLRDPQVASAFIEQSRPSAVIHLAERKPRSSADSWTALADNLVLAGNVLMAISRHAPHAPVLIAGSAAQYGLGSPRPLAESAPTRPISPYGAGKCLLEQATLSDPLRGETRVIWTRSFNHVGRGQPVSAPIASWAYQAAEAELHGGDTVRTGRLDVVRDFLDVRDVADAYISLVKTNAAGAVNVCSGQGVRLQQVAEQLIELSTVPLALEFDRRLERTVDPASVVGDATQLRSLTGWQPAYSLEESLVEVLTEWRARAGAEILDARQP